MLFRSEDPVVEWTKGTMLRPLLDNLSEVEGAEFLESYTAKIAKAYPHSADGKTVFPFKRLFIVAVK